MSRVSDSEITVGECLAKIARQPKVKTSDYLESGTFPVIDQGTKFVGGYVNDKSLLYTGPLPVVIFGDHNRNIKFVKGPFAVGADGTQLLYPDERFDLTYFYYAIRAMPLKNYGYERHFKYLKEERLRVWPLDVQRRIAAILSPYDDLIENNMRRIAILEEMARRIYEEWFVRFRFPGHERARMVESELGLVPILFR
jgi:type I restriction enzyme, S subunit